MNNNHISLNFHFLSLSILLILSFAFAAELCHPDDKTTLLQIKKSFSHADDVLVQWTPNTDCCTDWYGVQCNPDTHRVSSIFVLNGNVFAGRIPESVGNLPYLEALSFRNLPNLVGPLPKSIAKLKYLNSIWITKTNLSGQIPSSLGQLSKLNYINLQYNSLSGPIPPSLANLRELSYLALDGNQLTGPIPATFGAFAKTPDLYLKLSRNKLSGPIPKSLGGLVGMTELDLNRNMLSGDASVFFGKGKKLARADVSRNLFSFDLTKVVFSDSLNIIELSHNMIYGSLPSTLATIPDLQQFNVSYNKLCGKIPAIGKVIKFDKSAYVNNKCLCGAPLPACK